MRASVTQEQLREGQLANEPASPALHLHAVKVLATLLLLRHGRLDRGEGPPVFRIRRALLVGGESTGGGAELARCTFAVTLSSERMRLHLLMLVLFMGYITNRSNLNDADPNMNSQCRSQSLILFQALAVRDPASFPLSPSSAIDVDDLA